MCQVVRRKKEGERKLPLTWDKTKKMRERAKQFGGVRTIRRKERKEKIKNMNKKILKK